MNPFAATRVGLGLLGCLCAGLLAGCNQPVDEVADAATATTPDAATMRDAATDPLGPNITTGTLTGTVGEVFHRQLTAEGGTPPYTWSLEPGSSLPVGLSFGADGWINGTPSASGRWVLVVKVTDVHGRWDSRTLELVLSDPAINDRCSAPMPLVFSNGVAKVSASLSGAMPDGVASSCNVPSSLPDRFFSFELAAAANVSVSVSGAFVALLYQPGCNQRVASLPCGALVQGVLPKGSYVVGVAGPATAFELTVTTSETPTSGGDSCADITALDLSTGSALIQGTFAGAKQDFTGCGYGIDRVYSFTLKATSTVLVTDGSGTTDRSIRAGPFCATSTLSICRRSNDSTLQAINLPAGTYYLVIASYSSYPTASYSVQVTVSGETPRPVNDKCEGATPVVLVGDQAVLSGDMVAANADPLTGSCGATQSRDLYFALDLEKPSRLQIEESDSWDFRVQLLAGTCSAPTSMACGTSSRPLCVPDLQPGRYYLRVILEATSNRTTFNIPLTRHDPLVEPPNATCAAPEVLTLKAGVATAKGTLAAAGHSFALSCVTNTPELHDLVYKLPLDKRTDLKFSTTAGFASYLNVAVFSGSCADGQELSCRTYSQGHSLWGLDPGDYWVVVQGTPDSFSGACWDGAFTLTVTATASAPQPENDRCTSPTLLTLDGPGKAITLSGTLRGASNDFSQPSCTSTDLSGPDVVYDLDLKAGAKIRVSPLGTLPYSVGYYLTLGCGSTVGLGCSQYGSSTSFTTGALPAGHYYLVVDSRPDTTPPGDFALVVDTL